MPRVPPYYVFRPSQLLRRRVAKTRIAEAQEGVAPPGYSIVTPWGLPLQVDLRDGIGQCLATNGVWDLVVGEAIARLADEGERAVDVGANVGYMTGVMAQSVGSRGRVTALEPHPEVFKALSHHCLAWATRDDIGSIEAVEAAASSEDGTVLLGETDDWVTNQGAASIVATIAPKATTVRCYRLDGLLRDMEIGVMKIDVEGHELDVLRGGEHLLTDHCVRDVIYEDHGAYPTEVSSLMEMWGYTVLALREHPLGVRLAPPTAPPQHSYDPSYLATAAPDRAQHRLRLRGWKTLRGR